MEQTPPSDLPLNPIAKAAETCVYVGQVDKVFNVTNHQFMPLLALARRICATGDDVSETVASLLHNELGLVKVDMVAFAPGRDTTFQDEHGNVYVNLWTKVELTPVEGDVAPFVQHLNLIFDQDETAVNFMLNFMAHMLQKPTVKLMCAPLIIGGQGIGKSMLGEFFARLVGERNTTFIDLNDLSSQFNSYARSHLIIVNEFSSAASKSVRALLKNLITSPTISLNQKNIAAIQIANYAALMMFSNDPAALPLERDDRRYFVWSSRAKRQPQEYYARLAAWMKGEGAAHTLHFLLNRDLSAFNPNAAPPTNASREALIHEAMSDQHQLLLEMLETGQAPFATDLVVTSDVAEFMNTLRGPRYTVRHIASFLQQIGAAALGQCRITDADGTVRKPRIWAVNNIDSWVGRPESDVARAYRKPGLPVPVVPSTGIGGHRFPTGNGLALPRPTASSDDQIDLGVTPQL